MVPAFAAPTAAAAYPNRLFFTYIPIGAIMDEWYPTGGETDFEFKRILKPLQAFRERYHGDWRAGPPHRAMRWAMAAATMRARAPAT